ncbi:hypothetical protein [Acidiphilium sp.]|uniref:glycine-rich domain-containing protein n=1 Tax=Acidiphilium sp. TaxID=527 RepID=UPI003CFF10E3
MPVFIFANNINTTLADALTSTATTITLASSAGLPSIPTGSYLAITLNDAATRSVFEVCWATAVSGANLTVLRGQEGTAAQSWLVGDYAYAAVTDAGLASLANINGSASESFSAANAAAGSSQVAPISQLFDVSHQNITASTTITAIALQTVVLCLNSSAITVTLEPGTIYGQSVEIIAGGLGGQVTVVSSVSSGTPFFSFPDGTTAYSWPITVYASARLRATWDGGNWRCQHTDIPKGIQVFTTSGTFTAPPGVTQVKATVVGGGGGGSNCDATSTSTSSTDASGAGGGAGGAAIGVFTVTPGTGYAITVGAGGASQTGGSSSSFASFCSATGGSGGSFQTTASSAGAPGGTGSGGQINITGGIGSDGQGNGLVFAGNGGASIFGGGGRAGEHGGEPGQAYGSGGGGAYDASATSTTYNGGAGAAGIVILEY